MVYLSAHSSLVQALLPLGRLGELLQVLKTALEVAEKNHNAPWVGIFKANLAWVHLQCGDLAGARRLAEELMHQHVGKTANQIRTMATITSAFVDLESDLVDSAVERFNLVIETQLRSRFFLDWYWRMMANFGLSQAWLKKGELARAGQAAGMFFELAASSADPGLKALSWEMRARVAVHNGDQDCAREFAGGGTRRNWNRTTCRWWSGGSRWGRRSASV